MISATTSRTEEANDAGDWIFRGEETRSLTHCYHDYPARMIPQVARKLLDLFAPKPPALLLDPYCGTGTSLVEGMLHGLRVVGTELNPLARLIARAKTTLIPAEVLDAHLEKFQTYLCQAEVGEPTLMALEGIRRPAFWFQPEVFQKLATLRTFLYSIEAPSVHDFFAVAFSETVREASNTRKEEFKLCRYREQELERHKPDPFRLMTTTLMRNRKGLLALQEQMGDASPFATLYDFNTVSGVPSPLFPSQSVDIVVTSPPYGDSRTTVAYGQYSRLSSVWLGLPNPVRVDRTLMGGKALKRLPVFPSADLNDGLSTIAQRDRRRALEVAAFYADLLASLFNLSPLIKPGGYVCYVVGNRRVKGVVLPTNLAVCDFFEYLGYNTVTTFQRGIPNKRMPSRNSPTNTAGKTEQTMLCEYIVVLQHPRGRRQLN